MGCGVVNPWIWLGILNLALAVIGAILPLMPTTVFVLMAAACFARSSPRMHAWLRQSQLFGPVLRNWEDNRCMPRRARITALTMMILVGGVSVLFFVPETWMQWVGAGLIALGCAVVLRIPVCECEDCQ